MLGNEHQSSTQSLVEKPVPEKDEGTISYLIDQGTKEPLVIRSYTPQGMKEPMVIRSYTPEEDGVMGEPVILDYVIPKLFLDRIPKTRSKGSLTDRTHRSISQYLERMNRANHHSTQKSIVRPVTQTDKEDIRKLKKLLEEAEQKIRILEKTYHRTNVFQQASHIWKGLSELQKQELNQIAKLNQIRSGWQQLIREVSNHRSCSTAEIKKIIFQS